jgi:uncharacterized protein (TIGR00725 family)
MKRLQIGIIGPEKCNYPENSQLQNKLEMYAEKVGELLAERNAVVLTGGGDGVMEAVFRGAKRKNGLTVGIPGKTRGISNPYTDVEILTPLDVGDYLIVRNFKFRCNNSHWKQRRNSFRACVCIQMEDTNNHT